MYAEMMISPWHKSWKRQAVTLMEMSNKVSHKILTLPYWLTVDKHDYLHTSRFAVRQNLSTRGSRNSEVQVTTACKESLLGCLIKKPPNIMHINKNFACCVAWSRNTVPFSVIKSGPVTRHGGALGERRYSSSYSFWISALERGEWSASRPGCTLPPEKEPPVPTVQEAGWAPESVWTQRLEEKSSASVADRTPAVQSVVRHYTDWATRAHSVIKTSANYKGSSVRPPRKYLDLR
jgi:hypothetical protein